MRQKRRIRRNHNNDRTTLLTVNRILGNLFPDWNSRYGQLRAPTTVRLHQNSHYITAALFVENARGRSGSALEFVANHSGPAANATFGDWATLGAFERVDRIIRLNVKAVDVIEIPVPGFGYYGQTP